MPSRIAQQRHKEIARAIDDGRAVGEAADGVDIPTDEHDPADLLQRTDRSLHIGQRGEGADPRGVVAGLRGLLPPHLTGVRQLAIVGADGAGAVQQIAGPNRGHVVPSSSWRVRQRQSHLLELILDRHDLASLGAVGKGRKAIRRETRLRQSGSPTNLPLMNLAAWQDLAHRDPALAAATLLQRLRALPPAQQRAIVSWQPDASDLAAAFARQTARPGPLSGVPYFAKDLFPVRGVPMHAGSGFLAEIQPAPTQDAALVSDLAGCGAVLAGTAHLHEFAYGLTGDNPHWGNVDIPGRPGRTPGGSSSGSAALVAAGVVPLALGTDTGGSVRVPAAYCGLFGFRTTPGSRWISDAFPLAPGFDTAGWFTRSAEDMLQVKTALLGTAGTERRPRGAYLGFADWAEPDPGVAEAIDEAARRFSPVADAMTREQLIRGFRGSSETYATLQSIEAYGVHADWLDRYRDRYGSEVWQRLDRGRRWTDLERDQAVVKQTALRLLWTSFFLTYDYLVLPATPFAAPLPEQRTIANRQRILTLTTPASVGGLPVLTIPVPLADGLSTGLQIVVNHPNSPVVDWALQQAGAERR